MSSVPKTSVLNFEAIRASLRPRVEFIGIRKMYSKPFLVGDGELEDAYPAFTLWKAWVVDKQPPIVIYDDAGTFRPNNLSYSLTKLDVDADDLYATLPKNVKTELEQIQDSYGAVPDDCQRWWILYHETPALRDVGQVRRIFTPSAPDPAGPSKAPPSNRRPRWSDLVSEITDFKGPAIDPRLKLIRLCHLPRGREQGVNGHAVVCLPGNTAKSSFYELTGPKDEKTTANSTVGYADTDGVHPGSVDGTEHTFTIDQFESQGAWQVFRYLQSLMESGKARVDTSAQPFLVRSSAIFVILANPGNSDPSKSFMFLLEHMVKEPSFGRRFGIILYDTQGYEVKDKLTKEDEERWRLLVDFYRAVEAIAEPEVARLYADPEVWTWLNFKPYGWVGHLSELIAPLQDEQEEGMRGLRGFLRQFIQNGMTHARGAALAAAVASNLDRILLKEIGKQELLSQAEDYFSQVLDLNEYSVRTIAQNFREERVSMMKAWFDSRPAYLKEVIREVLAYMKKLADSQAEPGRKINLSEIASLTAAGGYFSRVVDHAKRSNPERHNEDLKRRLGFELIREGQNLLVAVESFDVFQNFQIFQIVGENPRVNERIDQQVEETKPEEKKTSERPSETRKVPEAKTAPTPPVAAAPKESQVEPSESHLIPWKCFVCGKEILDAKGEPDFSWNVVIGKKGHLCRSCRVDDAKERREASNGN